VLDNLTIGGLTMAVCLVIQCSVVSLLLRVLIRLERRHLIRPTLIRTACLLIAVMLVMLAGNVLQMAIWAGLFCFFGEFKDATTAFYHSVVNFSTLGYGDMVMSPERRLLGALEAANGVLMFGLTTSVLFTLLSTLSDRAWNQHLAQATDSRVAESEVTAS
jgi:hypothetical protein